jgi:hypothetical protein
MASVIDPRKPKLLVPLLIGDWINNIAACGLAISLAVSENMTRKIFGAYGCVVRHYPLASSPSHVSPPSIAIFA